jgi:hypothetical protein
MRLALLALAALALTGCAGAKFNFGYDFIGQKFFAEIERPLEPGLKK